MKCSPVRFALSLQLNSVLLKKILLTSHPIQLEKNHIEQPATPDIEFGLCCFIYKGSTFVLVSADSQKLVGFYYEAASVM